MTTRHRETDRQRERGHGGEDLPSLVRSRLFASRMALTFEAVIGAVCPALALALLFLVIALLGGFARIDATAHAVILAIFAIAIVVLLVRAALGFRFPSRTAAARRIEVDNGLAHHPFDVLDDHAYASDAASRSLWQLHRAGARDRVLRAKVRGPRDPLPGRDPRALRAALLLGLIVALVVAAEDRWPRVAQAFAPNIGAFDQTAIAIDLWIEPPAYTGRAPIVDPPRENAGADDAGTDGTAEAPPPIEVPEGSTVIARVSSPFDSPPVLRVGDRSVEMASPDGRAHSAEASLDRDTRLAIEADGHELAAWNVSVIPDGPPFVDFREPPEATARAALRIAHVADDDYGVETIALRMRPADPSTTEGTSVPTEEIAIPVSAHTAGGPVEGVSFHDLTAHRWAGQEVELQLVARDAAGNAGESPTVRIVLPERVFHHPIARMLVAERARLHGDSAIWRPVAESLEGISRLTDMYEDDLGVFLGITSAKWRLVHARPLSAEATAATEKEVRDLLWDIALELEDGGVSIAERELRAAERALADALESGASDTEIRRLIEELRQAIRQFAANLASQSDPGDRAAQEQMEQIQGEDLNNMLDRIGELGESGAKDAAQQLLAQLQQMLEQVQSASAMNGQSQQAQQMMQQLNELGQLGQQQRELMDQTFGEARQRGQLDQGRMQPGQPGSRTMPPQPGKGRFPQEGQGSPSGGESLSARQESLRRALGDLMRRMGEQQGGEIPNGLGAAEQAMRDALESLGQGSYGNASGDQGRALEQLEQAARSLGNQFARQLGVGRGQAGRRPGEGEEGRDPLGRDGGLTSDTGGVRIPERGDLQRARTIRDELYRRAGERDRPGFERDYIERLLDRF